MNKSYSFSKNIPSCDLNKELIRQLEDYLLVEVPKLLGLSEEDLAESIHLNMVDALGEERLESISDYKFDRFPNNLSRLSLQLEYLNRLKPISVKIYLEFNGIQSKIRISIESEVRVKEKALVIMNGLFQIIRLNKNYNFLLYGLGQGDVLIFMGAMVCLIAWMVEFRDTKKSVFYVLMIFLSYCYLGLFRKLKPYISVDTTRQRELDKFVNWLIFGVLTFIIFGSALTFLRKEYLGF